MIATIWGARGSVATPGPAPAPRPRRGPPVLHAALGREGRATHLGAAPGAREPGGRDRTLHVAPALPRLDLRGAGAYHLPRSARRRLEARLGRVSAAAVRHRGPTVGYRIEEGGRSLVYIPDDEPYAGPELLSGFRLARDASILLHDAQHFESKYPAQIGWGHSSVAHTVAFARRARARRLVLFHHDPLHSDGDLELLETRAAELWKRLRPPELAREGMRLTIGPARESPARRKDRGVTTVRPEAGGSIIAAWSKTTCSTGG
jgi:hypothetical protein